MALVTSGKFIAFEGGEGTGKSTQARLLAAALETKGLTVVLTREPGGTPGAESVRQLLLHPPGEGWLPRAEALLFAAARSDHVERLIRPALREGQWVITDRFVDSSRAYQGEAGMLGDDAVCMLHKFGSDGLRPNLTLVLHADDALVGERIAHRDGARSDAIGGRDAGYHGKVNDAFLRFARDDPRAFALIDGRGRVEEVHGRVLEAMAPLMGS